MQTTKTFILIACVGVSIMMLFTPMMALAQDGGLLGPVVPCGIDGPDEGSEVGPEEQCHFEDLVELAQNIVNFLIAAAVFLAVILFTYAGFLYVTAAGDTGKVAKAHSVFRYTITGFIIVLAAWLIVNFIVTITGADSRFILLDR